MPNLMKIDDYTNLGNYHCKLARPRSNSPDPYGQCWAWGRPCQHWILLLPTAGRDENTGPKTQTQPNLFNSPNLHAASGEVLDVSRVA